MSRARHIPVLLREAVDALAPRDGGIYIDGTFGAGGYAYAILAAAKCRVLAIDRDPDAVAAGRAAAPENLTVTQGRFGRLDEIAREHGVYAADGVALDVGVSSMQLDDAERGFSFSHDGPLDMRMERKGESAADVVNSLGETQLARVIARLGEEKRARSVARAIAKARVKHRITRTGELADIVAGALGRRGPHHPATRTFQALRIYVNRELEELAHGLAAAERILKAGGRLAVVTFHSLEDRIAKLFFAERARPAPAPSRHAPAARHEARAPSFELLSRKPVTPSESEIRRNPRARSARLRAARRTSAPAFPFDQAALPLPKALA